MKVILDADCLIKLTKAGLKEDVCKAIDVAIPHLVKEEVVDRGKARGLTDAFIVERNINSKLLKVKGEKSGKMDAGEKEAVMLFQNGGFDAIGSDDRRFIKQLRLFNIPYITPAVFIAVLLKSEELTLLDAKKKLDALSEYISENEYYTVKGFLEQWRK